MSATHESVHLSFRTRLLAAFLVLVFAVLLLLLAGSNTTNMDEAANIAAGMSIWKYGCFDIYPVNPPLVKLVASFPFLFHQPDVDWKILEKHWQMNRVGSRPEFSFGLSLVRQNTERVPVYFFFARLMCIPFSLFGAYFCWRWASELYGECAGLCALVLWCFSPNVLTWGSMVLSDLPASACGIMCGYFFWHWLKKPEWSEVFSVSLTLGLVLLTKLTWFFLIFLLPILWAIWFIVQYPNKSWYSLRSQFAQIIVILIGGLFVLNLGYGFEGTLTKLGDFKFASRTLTGQDSVVESGRSGNRFIDTPLQYVPVPLPKNYVIGADLQKVDFEKGLPSYLNGQWSDKGWWYFYLECLLLKVPLGTLGLFVLAVIFCLIRLRRKNPQSTFCDELILLIPAIFLLVFVSSQTGFSRHFRYVLPSLPFFMIGLSKVFAIAFERMYFLRVMVCGLLLWTIVSCLSVFPYTMSYFNELAGGAKCGHFYLLDSNIDWGQDTLAFKRWLANHQEIKGIHIGLRDDISNTFFFSDNYPAIPPAPTNQEITIKKPGVEEEDNDPRFLGPRSGWFAISVQKIHERSGRYMYFLDLQPKYRIGYSIYIYHLTIDDANMLRAKYGLPKIEKPAYDLEAYFNDIVRESRQRNQLKIALFTCGNDDDAMIKNVQKILDEEPLYSWQTINARQIREGELQGFDIVIFPGGNASEQSKSLEMKGKVAVRDFVQNGGGYLGICAGAFLATTNDSYGLNLINARAITGSRYLTGQGYISQSVRGSANVDLGLTDLGCVLFGEYEQKTLSAVYYSSSPIFYPAFRDDLPDFISLATFKTETWLYEYQKNEMIGKPSIITATYHQGRIFLISPHIEASNNYKDIIKKSIKCLSNSKNNITPL
jgi:glutamine amidotransferase-like uncharacterized protein